MVRWCRTCDPVETENKSGDWGIGVCVSTHLCRCSHRLQGLSRRSPSPSSLVHTRVQFTSTASLVSPRGQSALPLHSRAGGT